MEATRKNIFSKTRRILILVAFLLIIINSVIYILREKGFEYKEYYNKKSNEKLIASLPDCITKWTKPQSSIPTADVNEAKAILVTAGINLNATDEEKVIAISNWLINELKQQSGNMSDSVNRLPALQQYKCFKANKNISYDCGNFQPLFSLFCASADLPCRYLQAVQIPGSGLPPDSHVTCEVFIKPANRWVLADGFQNHILLKRGPTLLSAAEWMDYNLAEKKDVITVIKQENGSPAIDSILPASFQPDAYFGKHYRLYFYKETDLSIVYNRANRIKRYIFPHAWYQVYAPQEKQSNLLFRIKQAALITLAAYILLIVILYLRRKK